MPAVAKPRCPLHPEILKICRKVRRNLKKKAGTKSTDSANLAGWCQTWSSKASKALREKGFKVSQAYDFYGDHYKGGKKVSLGHAYIVVAGWILDGTATQFHKYVHGKIPALFIGEVGHHWYVPEKAPEKKDAKK